MTIIDTDAIVVDDNELISCVITKWSVRSAFPLRLFNGFLFLCTSFDAYGYSLRKRSSVHLVIQGSLMTYDLVGMIDADMVQGLSFMEEMAR